MLYISDYIFSCYAFLFIFDFPNPLSKHILQFLAFLSGTGLIFVGAAPCFKLELEGKVHYIATGVCGVASLVWICLTGYWLFPLLLFASCIYLTYRYQRPMFWVECSLFLSVYLTVFCLLL